MEATAPFNLQITLRRWDFRRRLLETLIWLPRGAFMGVLVGIGLAIISRWRLFLTKDETLTATLVSVGVGLVVTLVAVWVYPRSTLWLARHFDRRFGLKERLSTALELRLGSIPPADALDDYLWADTRQAAGRVQLREQLPLKPNYWEWVVLLLAVLALWGLLRMDNRFDEEIIQRRELDAALEEQIEALENTREDIINEEALSETERQELLTPLDQALETLREPEISREEAFAALSEAEQELRELSGGLSEEEKSALAEAGQALSESQAGKELADELAQADLEGAAEALNELAEDVGEGELTPEELSQLADQLDQAADALEQTNPEAAQAMRDAAEALRNGDLQGAQEAMQQAAEALEQQSAQAQQGQQAQSAQNAANDIQANRQQMTQGQPQQGQQQQGQQQQGQPQQGQEGQQQQGQPQQGQQQQGQQQQGQQQQGEQQQGQQQQGQQGQLQQGQLQQGQQQQGQGQGQQQGQINPNSGQSSQGGSGSGVGEGGAGRDTTQGQESTGPIETNQTHDGDSRLRNLDSVFAPNRLGDTGSENILDLQGNPLPNDSDLLGEGGFNNQFQGDSRVPYDSVFATYADEASQTLGTDYIPIGLRDVIRDYFSSLEP